MRIWKPIVFCLILASVSGCAGEPASDAAATPATPAVETAPEAAASAPAAAPAAAAPKPAAAPRPAATAAAPAARADAPAPAPVVRPVAIPSGTELSIILSDALNSGKNKAGDPFSGHLAAPIQVNGRTIIDRGATVHGRVVDAEDSGRVKGLANMRLVLTGVEHRGKIVPVTTTANFIEAKATKGRDAAIIGGGAGVGAVIGAIAGGKKGAATGGIIGGAAGTGTVLATKGEQVDLPAESKLDFTLEKGFEVIP